MIYKLTFKDGKIDWCTAKSPLHLLQSYDAEWDLELKEISDLQEITDEEAKTIMVVNPEFDEDLPEEMPEQIPLFDLAIGDEFTIITSTDFD